MSAILMIVKNFFRTEKYTPSWVVMVKSEGKYPKELKKDLFGLGYDITEIGESLLGDIIPTMEKIYKVAIIKKEDISPKPLTFPKVRRFGKRRGLKMLPIETAPLLRKAVSDKDMEDQGVWQVVCMHKSAPLCGDDYYRQSLDDRYRMAFGRYAYGRSAKEFGPSSAHNSWFGAVKVFSECGDMGTFPTTLRDGGAFAFLMDN